MFDRLLLHITDECLAAYRWCNGALTPQGIFRSSSDDDLKRFGELADAHRGVLTQALVDVVEEDFQRSTSPHVLGSARNRMIERNLHSLYHNTPYRRCVQQGRQSDGRRDDVVLYSAITRPELLEPWLKTATRHQLPLAGLHSPAYLSEWLIERLGIDAEHVLLVSHQSAGIRQTYLEGGQLRFSRLVAARDDDPQRVGEVLAEESGRTHIYLLNNRLLARDVVLDVVVLADASTLAGANGMTDTPTVRHTLMDVDAAYRSARLACCPGMRAGDTAFVNSLAHARRGSAYPLATPERRYQKLFLIRRVMHGVSLVLGLATLAVAGSNLHDAELMRDEGKPLRLLASALQSRHEALMASAPTSAVPAEVMRAVVEMHASVERDGPAMDYLLYALSRALEREPSIELTRLEWAARDVLPDADVGAVGDREGGPPNQVDGTTISTAKLGLAGRVGATLRVDGLVLDGARGYRSMMADLQRFTSELASHPEVRVGKVRAPLDLAPEARLSMGGAVEGAERGAFSIIVVHAPEPRS
jgi:hypothetical protein